MRSICSVILLMLFDFASYAQDSLFVVFKGDKWVILQETELGENLFILAKRYHVPAAILADENGLNFQDGIEKGSIINIPFSKYNQGGAQPFDINATRPVYYRVNAEDNLFTLSKYAGVPQRIMQQWNNLPDNTISEGEVLFAGWVLYDSSQTPFSDVRKPPLANTPQNPPEVRGRKDSVIVIKIPKQVVDTLSDIEGEYLVQTDNGLNVMEEKGTISFFNSAGKVRSSDTYYAFYNGAPKGTVIKVHNPGTDKTIYVKVLGPLPATKQYYNAIMGLGSVAKTQLGVIDSKAWCEIAHAAP
jgi:hypothetical protein